MASKDKKMVPRKWLITFICLTLVFAAAFTAVFIHGGYPKKVLTKLGLRNTDVPINWSARGWDRCLNYMGIDADAVMFGDSITSGGDFSKYFPDITICNLGIPGDDLLGLTERAYMLSTVKPEKVFILAGINCITNNNVDMTYKQYEEMIKAVQDNTDAVIFIIGILPVSKEKEASLHCSNKTIIEFNKKLEQLAEEKGLTYIDLNTLYLLDGAMNPSYTNDGVHLTDEAYDIWADTIAEYMR